MEPTTPVNQPTNQNQAPQPSTQPQQSRPEGIKKGILKKFPKSSPKTTALYAVIALLVVSAGIGTGWLLSGRSGKVGGSGTGVVPGVKEGQKEAGLSDEETFRDSAEGTLEEGGVNGEGTHHLVREGGSSQNVYLTSTVIDLQSFAGKKVTVWGETIAAQKAGWLMDVGRIKVVE
ncbi:hypothetical protein E3I18_00540 [Candidatus Woesebacteria bacterium]|nr:MAG: hypothetical protein E3I18_00540 [Candidatus Woesebacteria bacterium]